MNKNRELIAILRGLTLDRCIVVGKILIAAGFTKLEVPLNSTNPMETILAMKNSIVPPTINLENKSEEANNFNLVPNVPIEKEINYSLSNSFGFGGTNASLVFKNIN